jgi:hypothetical protein
MRQRRAHTIDDRLAATQRHSHRSDAQRTDHNDRQGAIPGTTPVQGCGVGELGLIHGMSRHWFTKALQ